LRSALDAPPAPVAFSRRNFWAWVAYTFFFRVGWQFKLEATLVSGLVSFLAPANQVAVTLGWLGTLRAVGRNILPLVIAPWVGNARRKRGPTLILWATTVAFWAALTVYLWLPAAQIRAGTLWVFGAGYVGFHTLLGGLWLAQGTLLGRIIPDHYRGRALAAAMGYAGMVNVGALWLLAWFVKHSGIPEPRNYALSFTISVTLFIVAGLGLALVREQESVNGRRAPNPAAHLGEAVRLVQRNRDLALLLGVNAILAISLAAMPLYTAYWRSLGTITPDRLLWATMLQVGVQSASSWFFGRLADRRGNRLVICLLLLAEAGSPLLAVLCGGEALQGTWGAFLSVYVLVGLRFPLFQVLVNYLLEIVPAAEHATALSAVTLVQLATAVIPLVMGLAARRWGYPSVLLPTAGLVLAGAWLATRMREPRFNDVATAVPPLAAPKA